MSDPSQAPPRPPLASLAAKLIFFVFAATFTTALAVSAISIHATHAQVRRGVEQQYSRVLARCAERLSHHLGAGLEELAALAARGGVPEALPGSRYFDGFARLDAGARRLRGLGSAAELGPLDPSALPAEPGLAVLGPSPERVAALAPQAGGALVALFRIEVLEALLAGDASHPSAVVVLSGPDGHVLASSARERRDPNRAAGQQVIALSRPLAGGVLRLAFEVPVAEAFQPMRSVATPILLFALCVVILFSLLASRITARMLRPIEALSDGARRIAQGDLDLEIPEPTAHDEVSRLTRTFNDMMRRLRHYQGEIESANRTLLSRNEILSQLSITDGLTQLHNHRFFQDHLTREIKRASRTGEPLSMLLIDIDDFKGLNDRFGHAAGDELLVGMARIMSHCVRETDLLARYGGEEFVVLASNTKPAGAYRLAEKIRMQIDEASFILDDSLRPIRVTISVGVAGFEGDRRRFFDAADQALYRAKAAGKNCVVMDRDERIEAPPIRD